MIYEVEFEQLRMELCHAKERIAKMEEILGLDKPADKTQEEQVAELVYRLHVKSEAKRRMRSGR